MSQKSVKKGVRQSFLSGQVFSSAVITQAVCFLLVVSVAVLGFVQARRAIREYGGETVTLRQSGMYSGGSGDVSEVTADQMPDSVDGVSEKDASTSTSAAATKKTAKTTKKKTTASKTDYDPNATRLKILVTPVNIRKGAGREFDVIERTTSGKVYQLLSEKKGSDGKQWYQISLEEGKTGWIMAKCARVLTDSGEDKTTGNQTDKTDKTQASRSQTAKTQASRNTTAATSATSSDKTSKTTKTSKTAKTAKTTTTAKTEETFDLSQLKKVIVSESPVNIRSGPGSKYKIIGKTEKGKEFGLISTQKGEDNKTWCRIALSENTSGWILRSCCRDADETTTSTEPIDKLLMKLQPEDKSAKYFIVVYIGSQSTVVYKKDSDGNYTKQAKLFTCSTGKESSPTRTGKYHIRAKYRWRWLVGNVYGQYNSSISDDYLFHSVPYYKKDFKTLENEEYDKLGTPASKGCIRMCVRDCKWIYDNCDIGTQVRIVTDSGPEGPGVPKRKSDSKYSGWDPSDKWASGNPYFS